MDSVQTHSEPTHNHGVRQGGLDFLWLELTNRCNLHCIHCYTESSPTSGDGDILTKQDYAALMVDAYSLGCRKIQFIGGEPQLNPDFLDLLALAKSIGFDFVEVFSNLIRLSAETIRYAADNNIHFATSIYSDDPEAHDSVTRVKSSHTRTIQNLKRLIEAGVGTRVAIIAIDEEKAAVRRTESFVRGLGVKQIKVGPLRNFGRAKSYFGADKISSGLCGHCWAGKLCIAPNGEAYPCVMARRSAVGNVLGNSLHQIIGGKSLGEVRHEIYNDIWLPKIASIRASKAQQVCAPSDPTCDPDTGAPDCAPELQKKEKDDDYKQLEDCPQSCGPDLSTPGGCPQSCQPFIVVCDPSPE